ncbi:MAG: PAS domain S-box protein [Paludibacter sp.]
MENNNKQSDYNLHFYENTIEDLRKVISKSNSIKEIEEVNRLIQELEKSHLQLLSCFENPNDEFIQSIDNDDFETKETFRDLFENAPVGYHEIDINGRIVRMNQTDLKILGYTFEEIQDKYIWELFSQPDLSRKITLDKLKKGVINSIPYERLFVRKDGTKVPVLQMDKILKSSNGKISGIRTSVQDINERYEVELKLKYYSKFQQLLVNISSSFINLPLDKIEIEINTALRELGLFVGADRSYIFEYDFENQTANNTYEWCDVGIEPQIDNLRLVPISEMLEWPEINQKGEGIYIPDVVSLKHNIVREWLEPQGIKSLLTVPMMMNEKCIGFVGLDSVKQHHVYSDIEKDLLKVFAQMLVNIQLRKLAEEDLIESEFKYRQITENISDVVWLTDMQFNMKFISSSVEKLIGESVERHIKRSVEEKFTPASVEKLYSLFNEEFSKDTISDKKRTKIIEVEHYRADGSTFWAEMNVSIIRDENQAPIYIQGVTRDISQRRKAEESLRENERKYRVLFAENPQPMIIYDIQNLSVLEVNKTALDFYGYSREEFLKMTVAELHPDEELPTFFDSIEKTRKGVKTDGISLHKKKNGEKVYVKISSTSAPIMGSNARHLLLEDITQQKLAEDALIASEDKYRTMINYSNDLIWTLDKDGNFVFMNQMAVKTTELNPDDWVGNSFAPLVLPEDLEMMNDVFFRTINGESCTYEFRFKKQDNKILIWHVNTSPIYVSGKIEGVVSFARDITDKKQTELALDKKMKELIHFNDITIGRELKMIELKKEINELLKNSGKPEKYLIVR